MPNPPVGDVRLWAKWTHHMCGAHLTTGFRNHSEGYPEAFHADICPGRLSVARRAHSYLI